MRWTPDTPRAVSDLTASVPDASRVPLMRSSRPARLGRRPQAGPGHGDPSLTR
jgi:hypothetical protein